jgi:hypothetical protein
LLRLRVFVGRGEVEVTAEIPEAALGHAVKGPEKPYLRKHPPEPRRRPMDAWATYVGFYSPPISTPLSLMAIIEIPRVDHRNSPPWVWWF